MKCQAGKCKAKPTVLVKSVNCMTLVLCMNCAKNYVDNLFHIEVDYSVRFMKNDTPEKIGLDVTVAEVYNMLTN